MQKMMLLHAVAAPSSDILFNQFCFEIEGELDVNAFKGAWQKLVDTHPVLRAAFVWENLKEPVQAIRAVVEVPFELFDLAELPDRDQQTRREAILAQDRDEPFNPSRAPLLRVKLVRLSDRNHFLVWSSHHLLLDRWCLPIVLDDVGRYYDELRNNESTQTERQRSFRQYIGWIQQQDPARAEAYWRQTLSGFERGTAFWSPTETDAQREHGGRLKTACLDEETTAQIREMARRHRVTVSCVFQGAVALALARSSETTDVVFGATVSGRPPDLDGVESIVGSFVNNVPIRVKLSGDQSVSSWLNALQRQQHERQPFDYVSRSDIDRWSDLLPGESLFDTLFVWLQTVAPSPSRGLQMRGRKGSVRTGYPVTISVTDDARCIGFEVRSSEGATTAGVDADAVLQEVRASVEAIIARDSGTVADLMGSPRDRPTRSGRRAPRQYEVKSIDEAPLPRPGELDHVSRVSYSECVTLRDLLLQETRSLLKSDAFGATDSFFEWGGNSLHAVKLHARLEALTGRAIPILELFKNPTMERMARAAVDNDWPAQEHVARAIRETGSDAPLFCVTAPGVKTIGYVALAERLSPARPVYVLQSPASAGGAHDFTMDHVTSLARMYLDAVNEVCPSGPLNLISMCGGAHVAVEMARILDGDNRRVAFIGLINAWSFYTVSWKVHLWRGMNRYEYYRRRLSETGIRGAIGRLAERGPDDATSSSLLEREEPDDSVADAPRDEDGVWWKLARQRPTHRPEKMNGTLTVFRLRKQKFFRVKDRALGWGDYARDVDVKYLSANEHLDIMRGAGLEELATMLDRSLEEASASS